MSLSETTKALHRTSYNGVLYREGTLSLGDEGQFNTTSIAREQRSYVAHKLGIHIQIY